MENKERFIEKLEALVTSTEIEEKKVIPKNKPSLLNYKQTNNALENTECKKL